ncbi:MAG: DUF1826 domain-containing protein [Gammaproteobacteria bacterium]|jgi:hypothetical protein
MAAVIPINSVITKEHYIADDNIDVLTRIYDENINLAVYKRDVTTEISRYVEAFLKHEDTFSLVQVIELNEIKDKLESVLPDYDFKSAFISDLYNICDMFAVLFDHKKIGFRLSILEHAMCPRFHVDHILCRLLTTYGGVGTEWLAEDNLDRNKLGRGSNGKPDDASGIYADAKQINKIDPCDIALLKGEAWPNNSGNGIVHRSPGISKTNPRLLLSLDFV